MVVFLALNIFMIYYFRDRFAVLYSLDYLKFTIFALATFRAANIISSEVVTKPIRAPFVDETIKNGKIIEEPKRGGFLGAFGLLIYCPSCSGVWISALLVYLYIFWPAPTFLFASFLALSGVERIISTLLVKLKT